MGPDDPNDLLFFSIPAIFYLLLHRIYLIPTLAYVYQHRQHLRRAMRTMGFVRPSLRDCSLALGASIVLALAGIAVFFVFPQEFPTQAALASAGPLIIIKGLLISLRGAGEEILFRGFVQGIFAKRFSAHTAILAQALLSLLPTTFVSIIQPTYWVLLPPLFIVVITLGFLRFYSKGIAAPLIVHTVLNIVIITAEATTMSF